MSSNTVGRTWAPTPSCTKRSRTVVVVLGNIVVENGSERDAIPIPAVPPKRCDHHELPRLSSQPSLADHVLTRPSIDPVPPFHHRLGARANIVFIYSPAWPRRTGLPGELHGRGRGIDIRGRVWEVCACLALRHIPMRLWEPGLWLEVLGTPTSFRGHLLTCPDAGYATSSTGACASKANLIIEAADPMGWGLLNPRAHDTRAHSHKRHMLTAQQIEKKRLEYEKIREQKRLFDAELAKHEVELGHMLEEHGRLSGHQSEPTTPPEYRENPSGFPSVFSRPNRYSLSSLTSPPGMANRAARSGSVLTSPQSGIPLSRFAFDDQLPSWSVPGSSRNSDDDEKEEAVRQDPTSHRSSNAYVYILLSLFSGLLLLRQVLGNPPALPNQLQFLGVLGEKGELAIELPDGDCDLVSS